MGGALTTCGGADAFGSGVRALGVFQIVYGQDFNLPQEQGEVIGL
jgi:hypothetical protein